MASGIRWNFRTGLGGLVVACAAVLAAPAPAQALELGYIRGSIGATKFDFAQTADIKLAFQRMMDAYNPMPGKLNGPTFEGGSASYSQVFWFRPDNTAIRLRIHIAQELWSRLEPGTYPLGDQPKEQDEQGWNGKCPDHPGREGYVQLDLYGPMKDKPNVMLLNTGDELAYHQTHRTRIHTDKATLRIVRVDRKAGWVVGTISGTASSVKSIYTPEDRLRRDVPCDAGPFKIKTIPLEIDFMLEVHRW